MKWVRRDPSLPSKPYGAMVGGLALAGAVVAAAWLRFGLPTPHCQFRELSGIPCMTCGATRMTEAILAGNLSLAAALNPLLFAVGTGVLLWSLASAVARIPGIPSWRIDWQPGDRKRLWLIGGSLALLNWGYLIYRGI